jgi:hypothetical protein
MAAADREPRDATDSRIDQAEELSWIDKVVT